MSFESEFERHRVQFQEGDPLALHEAVLLAAWNNLPVPKWAVPELESIMQLHAAGRFPRGKGVPGPMEESESRARDRAMHSQVQWLKDLSDEGWRAWVGDIPKTLDNAWREVAESFTRAYRQRPDRRIFTRDTVKAAYYRVERQSSKKGNSSRSDKPPDV